MRTTLQELVGESWTARMMSLNESLTEAVPGIGIAVGGALAALGSPRLAFSVAAAGSLIVTAVTIVVLRDQPESGPDPDPNGLPLAPVHGVPVMGAGLGDAAGADVTAPAPQDRDGAAVSAPDGR